MSALVERPHAAPPRLVGAARSGAVVAVADPARRAVLARVLRGLGASAVAEVASVAQARARAVALDASMLVVDAALPDGSGVGLAADLRTCGTRTTVVTASDDPYSVRGALAAGVRCYLVLSETPTGALAERHPGVDQLSGREVQVLRGVADGRSNKDVGDQLGLSALTVKSHLARIARKLGTGDRAEMVAVAMRAGVLD